MKRTTFGLALLGLAFLVTNAQALEQCGPPTLEHDVIYSNFNSMKAGCEANEGIPDHGSCPSNQSNWPKSFGPSWAPYGFGYIWEVSIRKVYSASNPAPNCSLTGVYEHYHKYRYRYADTGCPDFRPHPWGDGTCQGTEQPAPETEPTPEPGPYEGTQVVFSGDGAEGIDNVVFYSSDTNAPGVPAEYNPATNAWEAPMDAETIVFDGVVDADSHLLNVDTRVNGEAVIREVILRQKTLDSNDEINNTMTYIPPSPDGTHDVGDKIVSDEANGGSFTAFVIDAFGGGLKAALENPVLGGSVQ